MYQKNSIFLIIYLSNTRDTSSMDKWQMPEITYNKIIRTQNYGKKKSTMTRRVMNTLNPSLDNNMNRHRKM